MTGSLEHNLHLAAIEGVMISLWPNGKGEFQANVSEQGDQAWTSVSHEIPAVALNEALRQRLTGFAGRDIQFAPQPEQIDIEEAIAAHLAAEVEEDLIG